MNKNIKDYMNNINKNRGCGEKPHILIFAVWI